MPMLSFFAKLPEIAQAETRCITIPGNDRIPAGTYGFVESYCEDEDCDCRRVFINVISSMLEDFASPNLAPGLRKSKYAADFLRLFNLKSNALYKK